MKNSAKNLIKKVRNAKRNQEKKLANSNDNNARKFAAYIKSKTKTVTSIGPLKNRDGNLVTEDLDMAEQLNKFFASVFTQEETDTVPELEPETESLLSTLREIQPMNLEMPPIILSPLPNLPSLREALSIPSPKSGILQEQ